MLEEGSLESVVRVNDLYTDFPGYRDYLKGMAEEGIATTDKLSRCIGVGVYSEETGNAYVAHFLVESMGQREYLDGLMDFYGEIAGEEGFYPSETPEHNFKAFAGGNILPDLAVCDIINQVTENGGKRLITEEFLDQNFSNWNVNWGSENDETEISIDSGTGVFWYDGERQVF